MLPAAIISLRRRLPAASSSQPGSIRASHPRGARSPRLPLSLSGLAPDGVYLSRPVTRPLVSSYLTISPLPTQGTCPRAGGMFLWHCPWGHPHWPLASILLCGARTFLDRRHTLCGDARDCLATSRLASKVEYTTFGRLIVGYWEPDGRDLSRPYTPLGVRAGGRC